MMFLKKILICIFVAVAIFIVCIIATPADKGVIILEYHMINDNAKGDEKRYSVTPTEFREQLAYLKANGYETVSMRDFMLAKKGKSTLPEKPIVLTFDDGYKDNYCNMLPILEEFAMKATVYVVTNDIGKDDYLSYDELKEMQSRGVELGSHTANHLPLTSLSREKQIEEIKLSKLMLEWNGLDTIYTFSYPNGAYDENLPQILKENEYLTAVTGEAGVNTFNTDPYLLHRVHIVNPTFGLYEFRYRLLKAEIYNKLGIFNREIKK